MTPRPVKESSQTANAGVDRRFAEARDVRRVDRHQWAAERCFAWSDSHKRVAHRQERLACVFRAMQILSLTAIVCRRLGRTLELI